MQNQRPQSDCYFITGYTGRPGVRRPVSITDLYDTGVDNAGNALGDNVADIHYSIIAPTGFTATTVTADGFPIPPWVANTATSRWIGTQLNDSQGPDGGEMIFRTHFTIGADADLSSVVINGLGATDDTLNDVVLNGLSLGSLFSGFGSLTSFSITSGFTTGLNTLDFLVQNSSGFAVNPTGLRIQGINGSYETTVPEPSTLALIALGMYAGRRRLTAKF